MSVTATAVRSVRARLYDLNDGFVGVSTGFMTEARGNWGELVSLAAANSADVVELSALSSTELVPLADFLRKRSTLPFRNVFVHGPAKGMTPQVELSLIEIISELPEYVNGIVVHPETLSDMTALQSIGNKLLLENMDPRKSDGRTPTELSRFFSELPTASFCLDIAHAWLLDKSMTLAHEFVDRFGDRLAEVHISSIMPSGEHIALESDHLRAYECVLKRCTGVPWVLEAPPTS